MPPPAVDGVDAIVMHEFSIMQSTLDLALKQATAAGAQQVHELRLRVGRLSGVVPEALAGAFEVLRPGTLAAEAELSIESVPAGMWCAVCQEEFESPEFLCDCPRCGTISRELRQGREMELQSIEIS
jgi:hydrogenase nickel incorporation protein HypA/HybF